MNLFRFNFIVLLLCFNAVPSVAQIPIEQMSYNYWEATVLPEIMQTDSLKIYFDGKTNGIPTSIFDVIRCHNLDIHLGLQNDSTQEIDNIILTDYLSKNKGSLTNRSAEDIKRQAIIYLIFAEDTTHLGKVNFYDIGIKKALHYTYTKYVSSKKWEECHTHNYYYYKLIVNNSIEYCNNYYTLFSLVNYDRSVFLFTIKYNSVNNSYSHSIYSYKFD